VPRLTATTGGFARLLAGRVHYSWIVLALVIVATMAGVGVCAAPGVTFPAAARSRQPPMQSQEVAHGNNLRALMELEAEQVALVAGHEKIRRTRNGQRQ
jgi:hypothetical protein